MPKVIIDGRQVEAENGELLIEVAKKAGIEIPSLCYLKDKPPATNPCGVCVVEVIGEGIKRACEYRVEKDIEVLTNTPEVKKLRREVLSALVKNHYGDCKAPCHGPCPGGLNIQGYIGFIAQGDFEAALSLIKEKLPFPAVVGRVCPRFCEAVCRRVLVDEPVAINNLKRFVADYCLKRGSFKPEVKPSKGKKVAIIGAGPAGLSCAYYLRLEGYDVVVFDKEEEPGGLLRYGIPNFKLPRDVLQKEIESVLSVGIEFVGGKEWGKDFTLKDLFNQGFDAIFLAVGVRNEKTAGFPGEELALSGIKFLYEFNKGEVDLEKFRNKRVIILGCSYTAIETARILRRVGASVKIVFPRSRMEVSIPHREIKYAESEGVRFLFVTEPLELIKHDGEYSLTVVKTALGADRKLLVVEEAYSELKADWVIRAWGETVSPDFKKFGELEAQLETKEDGFLKVAPDFSTSVKGVFAGGDFVYGAKTVIQAVSSGRRAAHSISYFLEGKKKPRPFFTVKFDFSRGKRLEDIDSRFFEVFPQAERSRLKERLPEERVKDFEEVTIGLTEEEAIAEAKRCLQCGCLGIHKCEFRELLIKEDVPAFAGSKRMKYLIDKEHPFIVLDLNKCIACERCVRVCAHNAIEFKVINKGTPYEYITFSFKDNCTNCGNCVDVCPTGALTKKHLRVPYQRKEAKGIKSVCGYCGTGCNLTIWVKNDRILEITGMDIPPNNGSLCIKGRFGFDYYRHPDRLKNPLIRNNLKEEFKKVSWEEAISFVAEKLKEIKDKYGGESIGFLASSQISTEENYILQKIARVIFETNNVDCSARVCHAPSVVGLSSTVGSGSPCAGFDEIFNAETLFLIGSDPLASHPVLTEKILKALENGLKFIVADPIKIPLADKANLWLKLKPGTDVALLNGIAYVILKEKLYNEEFLRKNVENFENYRHYILSEWDPSKVERITGVRKILIEQAAYIFATSKSGLIYWGLGLTEHRSGSYAAMAAANLATLCGFWGKPGCGAMPLRGHCNVQGACDMGGLPYVLPGYQNPESKEVRQKFAKVWGVEPPANRGYTLHQMIDLALRGELKALYIVGYDIAISHSNLKWVWKALENLELVVVQDIFRCFTSNWAHVLLPGACVFEKEGTFTNGERRVQLFYKAVSPPGEAKSDLEILLMLAKKLGYDWNYNGIGDIIKEIGEVWSAYKGISYERLKEGALQYPCLDEKHPGTLRLFEKEFPRGKVHLALARYLPTEEKPTSEYPFILITGKRLEHFRCGEKSRRSKALMKIRCCPTVEVNPKDAEEYGIVQNEWILLKNKRGEVKVKVNINKRVPKGYLFTDYHFDTALVNVLVGPEVDEFAQTPEYKIVPVKIEKLA
ncbi:MAG: formate dehydrogenase subunit alpha [Thermodesulfobacteria bacterium]|nr:formate dehydrogenase subunit alpha [Thermodesulfobacteriota bacterium]